eukprot:TRINITY_DN993_c0_g2_i2.p1 TRINITY_DN993_c0_g2~~TRINITY_DN993_c0_g2_i2.p1  ORF type:complete len:592 (-),score=174.42 TRINITY_DN993_c0_g2_i2:107-1882(-)
MSNSTVAGSSLPKKKYVIAITLFKEQEAETLTQIIQRLGGTFKASLEPYPTECTHLIAANPSETEKFLCACAAGIWVLKKEFLEKSAEHGSFLPEEGFEFPRGVTAFSHVPRFSRMLVTANGGKGIFFDFKVLIPVNVDEKSKKGLDSLKNVLLSGGAELIPNLAPFPEIGLQQANKVLTITAIKKVPGSMEPTVGVPEPIDKAYIFDYLKNLTEPSKKRKIDEQVITSGLEATDSGSETNTNNNNNNNNNTNNTNNTNNNNNSNTSSNNENNVNITNNTNNSSNNNDNVSHKDDDLPSKRRKPEETDGEASEKSKSSDSLPVTNSDKEKSIISEKKDNTALQIQQHNQTSSHDVNNNNRTPAELDLVFSLVKKETEIVAKISEERKILVEELNQMKALLQEQLGSSRIQSTIENAVHAAITQELPTSLTKAQEQSSDKFSKLEKSLTLAQQEKAALQKMVDTLDSEKQTMQTAQTTLQARATTLENEKAALIAEITRLNESIRLAKAKEKETEELVSSSQQVEQLLRKQSEAANARHQEVQNNLNTQISQLKSDLKQRDEELNAWKTRYEQLEAERLTNNNNEPSLVEFF